MRMTPAKLRAQRANAQKSTGPRTLRGRRRSAQNRRQLRLEPFLLDYLRHLGADLAEVRRLWQDLLAVFWFVEPDGYFCLERATWHWWLKLDALRKGDSQDRLKILDLKIEKILGELLQWFAKWHPDWERWVRKEIGKDVLQSPEAMRLAVEVRLATLRRHNHNGFSGGPPGVTSRRRTQSSKQLNT